jgi:hypothetical protein
VGAPPVKSKMCSRKLVFQKYETFSRAVRENSLIEVSDLQYPPVPTMWWETVNVVGFGFWNFHFVLHSHEMTMFLTTHAYNDVSFTCQKGTGALVCIIGDPEDKSPIASSTIPDTLNLLVKWFALNNSGGESGPLVLIFAIPTMAEDTYFATSYLDVFYYRNWR